MPAASHSEDGMVDVLAEWIADAPIGRCGIPQTDLSGCCEMLKVRWLESFVAEGGRRLTCHFRAPDAESVRIALRRADIAFEAVWSATICEVAGRNPADASAACDFSPQLADDTARVLATAREEWLLPYGLELTRAIVSSDRSRIIGVCDTPEGAPVSPLPDGKTQSDRVWRCRRLTADPDGTPSPRRSGMSILIRSDGCGVGRGVSHAAALPAEDPAFTPDTPPRPPAAP
jgi:hypothetical protein